MTKDVRPDIVSAVDHFGPVSLDFYQQLNCRELTAAERKYVVSKLDVPALEAVVLRTMLNCEPDDRTGRTVMYRDFLEAVLIPELLRRIKENPNVRTTQ